MRRALTVSLLVAVCAVSANAATIAYWNLNDGTQLGTASLWQINPFGTTNNMLEYTSDLGDGTAELSVWPPSGDSVAGNLVGTNGSAEASPTNNFGSFTGSTLNAQGGAAAGGSLSIVGSDNNDHYFLIELDDALTGCMLSYATRGTASGFTTQTIDYSTDNGATWTPQTTIGGRNVTTFSVQTVDFADAFALTSGAEQNLICISVSGATSGNGNNRFDNILITGEIVPEPATLALLALGALPLIRRRR